MDPDPQQPALPIRRRRARIPKAACDLPAPEDKGMELVARCFPDEFPQQWTITLSLEKGTRVIEQGPFKTPARAMATGVHIYHEWTMPPRLRRKYRHLFEQADGE